MKTLDNVRVRYKRNGHKRNMFKILIISVRVLLLSYLAIQEARIVGIATGYRLDGWGSIPARDKRVFSSPQHPDRLWGPPSLLSNVNSKIFPAIKAAGA
jgi:hypothetical protein